MVIDDNVIADWATYVFDKLLQSIKNVQEKKGRPQYGLLISYILEKKMLLVEKGEQLADSDYLPSRNTRGKTIINQLGGNP